MTFSNIKSAIEFISNTSKIGYEESFELSKYCSMLLADAEGEDLGRELVIRIKDAWHKIPKETKPIWNDLTEAAGLYPYVQSKKIGLSASIRYEFHRSPYLEGVYLHEEQQILSSELLSKKSVVVSAPTSFGKSLLIEEVIASKIYKNIVIIQPTLALLDETRKKLLKYKNSYKIIVSTNQEPEQNKGNLFLFTGERVVEYPKFPTIDFFVIDEFYKLSLDRDDDRSIALNQAFNKLLKLTNKFYLLGPMIKSIPLSFTQKFDLKWFPTQFATVAVDEKNVEILGAYKIREKKEKKKQSLFELLSKTKEQTLIYCASPNRATELCLEFVEYLKISDISIPENVTENKNMSDWITENINRKWALIKSLNSGIAFHHGALPRHLGSSIVDAFNQGSVRWLFCTSTLIEGVNTSAKNVVLFDKEKGTKPIDFFDYKNIAGRSGRMKQHYIGNVFRFEKQPAQMDLFVDIPLFNHENAPLEILISLDKKDIDISAKSRLHEFESLPEDLQELIKTNAGISIKGQLAIIDKIEKDLKYYNSLLKWRSFPPNFDSLSSIIELCWDTLTSPSDKFFVDSIGRLSARWLASFTFSYINIKSLNGVINQYINDNFWKERIPNNQNRINIASFTILRITRHFFDYKLPKWLSVVSNIQKYVFSKNNLPYGDYTFLASNLEHGFLPPNLAALMEYDIPISAINKLKNILSQDKTPEILIRNLNRLSDEQLMKRNLIPYEINKIRNSI